MADKLKNLVPRLGKRGPHRVLTGDLDFAGLPGRVYTPAEGTGIPGIAFGHDWRIGVEHYHATLRHLDVLADTDIVDAARQQAARVVEHDPDLDAHPGLARAVAARLRDADPDVERT